MVYQRSQDIQTATKALLSFNPDCLELTLQGTQSNVTEAGSKVVMILEQLREQSSLEGGNYIDNESSSQGHPFFGDFLSSCITEKQSNNDKFQMPCTVAKGQPAQGITDSFNRSQGNNFDSSQDTRIHLRKQPSPTLWNIQPHSSRTVAKVNPYSDIEQDCATTSCSSLIEKPHSHYFDETSLGLKVKKSPSTSSFSSSSSDNENGSEEKILTDPLYSKQVEQALKLGYSENHVKKALTKLGPNCAPNDLLSELIQIGATDTVPEDFSSFSNSADFQGVSLDNSSLPSGNVVDVNDSSNLRHIIIDGSNVAMSHGKTVFSCKGIQIVVDWFRNRGHKKITAFVPLWRKETSRPDAPITDQEILTNLEKEKIVVFTPARRIQGKRVVCYDDRYILKLAVDTEGIVVSNDVYRDLVSENEDFRKVVDQRLLMYTFADDLFMPPEDPLGRLGPTLDNFLRKIPAEPSPKPQDCPYGKKCTYGNKCRFYHPERGFAPQKSITDTLKEQADLKLQERAKMSEMAEKGKRPKQKLARTKSLAPGEPLPFSMTPLTMGIEGPSKREKPKLAHSKSLGPPSKTSDYLNESRKKLEEAEMTAALERMALASESSSQREAMKQTMTPADTGFHTSSPVKTRNSKSPRASPAHLTVPKAEQKEVFCSGHLLLAKKLSDESTDNFFSEHTSSPSSTRTSSPVAPASKTLEQKPSGKVETYPKENIREELTNKFGFPHSGSVQHQQTVDPQKTRENIPNLSIFDSGISRAFQYSDSGDSCSSGYRHSGLDSPFPLSPNVFLRSPDSGNYSTTEPVSNLFQSHTEYPSHQHVRQQFKSYPPMSGVDQMQYAQEHPNLRRTFSSTGNVKNAEDVHQKLGRRGSAFAAPHMMGDRPALNPQNSMPFNPNFGPYGLTRQNSTSDPQIHNTSGPAEFQSMYPPSSVLSADSGRKFHDQLSMHGQQYQGDPRQIQLLQQQYQFQQHQQHQQQQPQFDAQQYQRLQHQQQQQQDSLMMSPQTLGKQSMSPWGEPLSHPNLSHRSSLGGSTQGHYTSHHVPVSMQSSSHLQHFPPSMGDQGLMSAGPLPTSTSCSSQMLHYQQPPMMFSSPPYVSAPRTMSPQNYMQAYHPNPSYPPANPLSAQSMAQARPLSSMPGVLSENAAILPDDTRYTMYYHLSSVFSEEVVRKVMNLNPNVKEPETLCKLIAAKKEEMGK